ncbi:MAG: glycosyltransferase [Halothece sp.]
MKILQVIPSVSPVRGGTSVAVLETVKALRCNGVDVEIATTNDDGDGVLDVPLNTLTEFEGVPVRFFSRFSPPIRALSEYIFSSDFTRWIWQNIEGYDLIEINSFFSYVCTLSAIASRQKKRPYIISPHGQLSPWVINQKRLKKDIYAFLAERNNLNRATAIHCMTKNEAEDVHNFSISSPTFTVPLGVYPPEILPNAKQALHEKYSIPENIPIILFLSRIHPKKRPDFLLQVLKELQNEQDFHLILAGSGDKEYVDTVTNLVSSLSLSSQITLTGFITGKDKDLLLQGSDIFVLPSYGENFGVAVAEAMAVGLPPIITPEVHICSDILAENAGLVIPGEIQPWIEAIRKLLISPSLREEMGKNGKKLASERYAWNNIGKNLATVYEAILEGNPLPKL